MPITEITVGNATPEPAIAVTVDFVPQNSKRSCSWQEIIKILEENGFGTSNCPRQSSNRQTNLQK
jgi:hypothetical protein